MSRYVITRANILVLGVLMGLVLLAGGLTWERMDATREARHWSLHAYEVMDAIGALQRALRSAESGQRGFLLTGDDAYLAPYRNALNEVNALQGELAHLTADNPAQQPRIQALGPLVQSKLEELAQTIQLRRTLGLDAALDVVRTNAGLGYMRQIANILDAMRETERALLATRVATMEVRTAWVRIWMGVGTLLAVIGLAWAARMLNQAWRRSYAAEAEQRSLAQQLRASLDSLSQGVAVFSPEHRLVNWNPCFAQLLDLPDPLLDIGTRYEAIVAKTNGDTPGFLETGEEVKFGPSRKGEPITYERTRKGGHQFELRRTPTSDGGFVLTISDMTKRAQAEAVLREAQKMQAIGQLTGGIAHDFNNLLTVILGNLEVAQARLGADHAQARRLERAAWAAQRGATLTSQLLAFARRQALAPRPIDLAASVQEMVPVLRRTLGEHIEVRYVEAGGLWPAMADAAQLESALLNLALNARDAMPGGGRLTIELANTVLDEAYAASHVEVRPGEYVMLAVSDTGHGMSPDVLARALEPFFTTKPDGKGTGLGLAMVFGFIKQSEGHLNIYSEPQEGTTIRLYLPRAQEAAGALPRPGSPVSLPRGSATVLLVEDEAAVREVTATMLQELGYRVLEAADGEEALRLFGQHGLSVDLVLTDVVLPGRVRGRGIADQIAALRPGLPVLFMSGYTENSIIHHGRLDPGVALLGKPFSRTQLARKVAEMLATSSAADDSAKPLGPRLVELDRSGET